MDRAKNLLIIESKSLRDQTNVYLHDLYELDTENGLYILIACSSCSCGSREDSLKRQLESVNFTYFHGQAQILKVSDAQWLYIKINGNADPSLSVAAKLQAIRV